jgi:TPR repeat protein/uncharacterized caspase-like protein
LAVRFVLVSTLLSCAAGLPAQPAGGSRGVQDVSEGNSSTQHGGSYFALVIGNSNYKFPDQLANLQTPRADASAIAQLLHDRYGFETKILLDASRAEILAALVDFRKSLHEDSNLLIFYAGHGYFDSQADQAYWIPVDALADDNSNWISMDDITSRVRPLPSKHVLVISDSCYSGAILADESARHRGMRELGGGVATEYAQYLASMRSLTSRDWMASGSMEPVEDGGAPGHSIFANALLEGLQQAPDPQFSASDLFYAYVKRKVAGTSRQLPQYGSIRDSGDQLGDFIFARVEPSASAGVVAAAASTPSASSVRANPKPATPSSPPSNGERVNAVSPPTSVPIRVNSGLTARDPEFCKSLHDKETLSDEKYVGCLQEGVDSGKPRAMAYLADMYFAGKGGLPKNDTQGVSLLQKAANLNDTRGMIGIGNLYLTGNVRAVSQNTETALNWYTKAANLNDSEAMIALAALYQRDRPGMTRNPGLAVDWLKKAGEAGNGSAAEDLGECYMFHSCEVGTDLEQGRKWWEKAASLGDTNAMARLGQCYQDGGCGVSKDLMVAKRWYVQAADNGGRDGMKWLGDRYDEGSEGFAKDHALALQWYQKAGWDPKAQQWIHTAAGDSNEASQKPNP